ncbi:MAG: radical SAM/SPASM domain-containing protein [Oscillospiraceae bacterium]
MINLRFKRVYIEISNICNLSCSFCSPLLREKRVMTVDEFRHIASEIKPHTSFIYFHVKGEPLMHPKLKEFLDIAHETGLRVNLTTNGTLLKKQQALLLSHPAVRQVNISLHSFSEQDDLNEGNYIKNAVSFSKLANEQGIYVVLRLWNLDKDNNISDESMHIMNYIESEYGLTEPLIDSMGGRQSVKIAKSAFVGWEQEFEWPSLSHDFVSDTGFCYGMRHQIAILVDGTVVPCCLDANGQAPLGNIYTRKFADIIETKRAKEIRHGFENRLAVNKLCKHCSFRTKFD